MKANVKTKKMMLMLPILIIPFLTMAFYALGGGQGTSQQQAKDLAKGLNPQLPDANLKEENLFDKLSFYDKAEKDSAKIAELMRNDPFYKNENEVGISSELKDITQSAASKYNQRLNVSPYEKTNNDPSDQLMQKLSRLQQELNGNTSTERPQTDPFDKRTNDNDFENDMDRLERMMNNMNSKAQEDAELKQMSGVMDKILDIQHPERIKEKFKEIKPTQENVWKVSGMAEEDTTANGFYSGNVDTNQEINNAVKAVINENQILVNGSIIKLRLLQEVFIHGQKIPEGNFVYGAVMLNGERLTIEINSIRAGTSLYEVKMEVYDMDGLAGVHIPGAITREVAKQSADNSLQMMELTTLDPSLKAQATAAGIGSVKNLLSKKTKLVKVMVKAGYKVLLKNK